MEVAVNLAFATHVYEFCGRYFVQVDGGPIGLRSTASLASLIMKIWDTAWLNLLNREEIRVLLYFRYVDDIRNFLRPLNEGWRWEATEFRYSKLWEEEDYMCGLTDQQRTMRELVKAMSSLLDFIQLEGEVAEMFGDRLPTLDTEIWVCDVTGEIRYSF